jgi:N6-adenosine-specific RNA methylase IME4
VAGVLAFAAAEAWVRPERCAGALWKSVLIAPIGEASEKPKLLIDRDYGPALTRIEMFTRPPFDRRGWWYWGDAVPDGLLFAP